MSAQPTLGIAVFPGTNCERETYEAFRALPVRLRYLWYEETDFSGVDLVVLPGGFSYGDYLRAGAIARISPLVDALREFVARGRGWVLGICNGFQVLTEAHLLPGALIRNTSGRFVCRRVSLRVENPHTPLTRTLTGGEVIQLPVAHGEGRYVVDEVTRRNLWARGQVLFTYTEDINGSVDRIAGVMNEAGTVFGMMPHPERAVDPLRGWPDGIRLLQAWVESWREQHVYTG